MMGTTRWVLVAVGLLTALTVAFGRADVVSVVVLVLLAAAATGISAVYMRVRRERKAREKAQILRRVADLEGQRRPVGPTAQR